MVEVDFGMSTHPHFVLREKPYYDSRHIQPTLYKEGGKTIGNYTV